METAPRCEPKKPQPRRRRSSLFDARILERADNAHRRHARDELLVIVEFLLALDAEQQGQDVDARAAVDTPLCYNRAGWAKRLRYIWADHVRLQRTRLVLERSGYFRA